ncbi:carbon-nitrogen hydrolase family protein [Actinoplanes sp. NPDC051346]|uniref:carbon-nitrogen hydrolase family protein n=1 Tax=Actinoplanes sp. NPDC051346 TaxID=3155048 RepID=UPI003412B180
MSVMIAQVPATWNVDANLATVRQVLDETRAGDVVVMPEGMLSGYGEDLTRLDAMDPAAVQHAVAETAAIAERKQVHLFCGSLLPSDGGWCNAGLFFSAHGGYQVYRKINLAMNERGRLHSGDHLPTIDIPQPGGPVTAGVQLCREIRFPEQWQYLASAGAQLFVYLTNAANTGEAEGVWRSHLISRAAENQRFLASANIAHPDQHCPSMVVSPRGEVLGELPPGRADLLRQTLDITQAGDWYLGQRRQDVLSLAYHGDAPPSRDSARRRTVRVRSGTGPG